MSFEINISNQLETQINSAFLQLHYTIASHRPLFYAYGENQQLLITDSDANNYFFNNNNSTVINTATSGIFLARVYESPSEISSLRDNDLLVTAPNGEMVLTTDVTGKTLLDQCVLADKRVVFNGKTYRVSTDNANYGLLARPFWDYKLTISQ